MRTPAQTTAIRKTRQHFMDHGCCPPGALDARLERSWARSYQAGLLPSGRLQAPDNLSGQALAQMRARHHKLLAYSAPVMEYLFEQVRHTHSIVVLADPCGTLMHTYGDGYFLGKAERVALAAGATWDEALRGTNAIGTALVEAAPVEVHGSEHYLERNGFLTCAASPIFSGTGQLLGVIDISGEHTHSHPHTLGLVSTAARIIENQLLCASSQRHLRLHLHTVPEGIGTLGESVLIVSEDGWIVAANRCAREQLLTTGQPGTPRLEDVLDIRVDDLLIQLQRRSTMLRPLRLRDGRPWFAQLRADTTIVRPVVQSAIAPPLSDALSTLQHGDDRISRAADKARRILHKNIPLLIQGESGVGKEWFARAVHDSSTKHQGPFVAVNCAAMPEQLIEAELFGYTQGAFTGAKREGRPGLLREADGGTLFLDEIGDMPLGLQTRLLRVLQERVVTPLGGGKPAAVDFNLVCATHRNLRDEVQRGMFRSDLYYRINGLTLELPPLRERTDFEALTESLLHDEAPQRCINVAPDVLAAFTRHDWPGNLRQYASVMRTACAMLDDGENTIEWHHIADDIREELQRRQRYSAPAPALPQNLSELSRTAVQQALESCRGNVSQAARLLGISRQTLYRKIGPMRTTT
jgi:transcriptional regulator of acetoin/glycerol metabolism